MAFIVSASANGGTFTPAPEGPHAAVCVDVIDYGIVETVWQGQKREKHRMAIAFQIDEQTPDGKPFIVRWWGNASLNEKANLRKLLEAWRGKKFTPEELSGFDVDKLIGAPALIQIVHVEKNDTTYANIDGIMKLPKGMAAPKPSADYVRVKDRPEQNGQAPVMQSRQPEPPPPDEPPAWEDDDSSLPF